MYYSSASAALFSHSGLLCVGSRNRTQIFRLFWRLLAGEIRILKQCGAEQTNYFGFNLRDSNKHLFFSWHVWLPCSLIDQHQSKQPKFQCYKNQCKDIDLTCRLGSLNLRQAVGVFIAAIFTICRDINTRLLGVFLP